ncbi:uncharacterized protein ACR2FA_000905 [Aphomia sociella]
MSLTKILRAPIKLFRKDIITFLIIRRYDLGAVDEKLRYISVKPTASISMLRQKVWHLLELPDYCEEIIILKRGENVEIPLTELRRGNDPQHPYFLEVWPPGSRLQCEYFAASPTIHNNMITMGESGRINKNQISTESTTDNQRLIGNCIDNINVNSTVTTEQMALNNLRVVENKRLTFIHSDYKKSDLSCRISSHSLFKLHRNKSRDSFTNILLKIQSDLSTLSNKLSSLENRIPS